MQAILTTSRCIIRLLTVEDLQGIYELESDAFVHTYLDQQPITSLDQASDIVNHICGQYKKYGIARWAIEDKKTKEFIGWVGFKYIDQPIFGKSDYIDLGYRLKRKFWGRGIGYETARACLDYGINELKYTQIFAMAHQHNAGSNAILKKLGFVCTGSFVQNQAAQNWYEFYTR